MYDPIQNKRLDTV